MGRQDKAFLHKTLDDNISKSLKLKPGQLYAFPPRSPENIHNFSFGFINNKQDTEEDARKSKEKLEGLFNEDNTKSSQERLH